MISLTHCSDHVVSSAQEFLAGQMKFPFPSSEGMPCGFVLPSPLKGVLFCTHRRTGSWRFLDVPCMSPRCPGCPPSGMLDALTLNVSIPPPCSTSFLPGIHTHTILPPNLLPRSFYLCAQYVTQCRAQRNICLMNSDQITATGHC